MRLAFRMVWPPAIAVLGAAPILAARAAVEDGPAGAAAAAARPWPCRRCSSSICGWVRDARPHRRVVAGPDGDRHADEERGRPCLNPILVADGATKAYADLVALGPARPDHPGRPAGRARRPQRLGQVDVPPPRRRPARPVRRRDQVAGAPAGTSEARAAVSFLPDEPVLYDDLSVREHLAYVAALHGVDLAEDDLDALIERRRPRRTGPTTSRRSSAAACASGRRSRSAWSGRSRCCSWTSRSSASTSGGKEALLEIFDELHADGAADRRRHPRPVVRRARRPLRRPARRRGRPRRPRHRRRGRSASCRVVAKIVVDTYRSDLLR